MSSTAATTPAQQPAQRRRGNVAINTDLQYDELKKVQLKKIDTDTFIVEGNPSGASNASATATSSGVGGKVIGRRDDKQPSAKAPDFHFQYACEGLIRGSGPSGAGLLANKRVQWSASFTERSLEELFYPSLQHFDIDDYKRRQAEYKRLHGVSDPSIVHLRQSTDPVAEDVTSAEILKSIRAVEKSAKWLCSLTDVAPERPPDIKGTFAELEDDSEQLLRRKLKLRYEESVLNDQIAQKVKAQQKSDIEKNVHPLQRRLRHLQDVTAEKIKREDDEIVS
jgi:DNA-binding ferritin-like protein